MTYCLGMLVEQGMVLIADTRTNAGVDHISTYRKLQVIEVPGERVLMVASAGSLSLTQAAFEFACEGFDHDGDGGAETLFTVTGMFAAANLLGRALRKVRGEAAPVLEAEGIGNDASFLVGGAIGSGRRRLFLVYAQGNFIECAADQPYLQIGERKYGKPILDRALTHQTPLDEALKLGLISFDSTMKSNLAVGLPLDIAVLRKGERALALRYRVGTDDSYFAELGRNWSAGLKAALAGIKVPPYFDGAR